MKIVCAWCDKDLGAKEPLGNTGATHGICPPCKDKFIQQARRP